VLIVAAPMMVIMPWMVKALSIPDIVGGAWLGGTLDTSGSVVAAGALISEQAMKAGVIVKFSQNALIGVAAFILSVWWTMKKGAEKGEMPSAGVIWERFPKFVLGFLVALLLLPIGIFIRIKNKKIDQKKYKKGVRISAISAMTIVIVFGLYFFSTFLGSC